MNEFLELIVQQQEDFYVQYKTTEDPSTKIQLGESHNNFFNMYKNLLQNYAPVFHDASKNRTEEIHKYIIMEQITAYTRGQISK